MPIGLVQNAPSHDAVTVAPPPGGFALDEVLTGHAGVTEQFHRELIRSRRFDRPVALVVVGPGERTGLGRRFSLRPRATEASEVWCSAVGALLAQDLRRFDLVGRHGDELLVLAPETDRTHARLLVARLAQGLARLRLSARLGLAVLPEDGTSVAELVDAARTRASEVRGLPTFTGDLDPVLDPA